MTPEDSSVWNAGLKRFGLDWSAVRFVITGGINAVFGYGVFALFVWLGLLAEIALLISVLATFLFSFVTYGRVVFYGILSANSFLRYIAKGVDFYLANAALLHVMTRSGMSAYLAQLVLIAPMSVTSFFVLRHFVFATNASGSNRNLSA